MAQNFRWPTAKVVPNNSRESVHISSETKRRPTSLYSDQGMSCLQPLQIELGKSIESYLHKRHRRCALTYSNSYEVKPRPSSMKDNVVQRNCESSQTSSRQQIYGQTPERRKRAASFDTKSEGVRSPNRSICQSPCQSVCYDTDDVVKSPRRSVSPSYSKGVRREDRARTRRGALIPYVVSYESFSAESRNTSPIHNCSSKFFKQSIEIPIIRISNYDADMLKIAQQARRFDEPKEDPMAIQPAPVSPTHNQWSDEDEEVTVRCMTPRIWLRMIRIFRGRSKKKREETYK